MKFSAIINQVRIVENNDWVILTLLGCGFLYLFMMISLQRDATIKEFLVQEFSVSGNAFLSWVITSLVFSLAFSVLISQYIPIVPKAIRWSFLGYEINKFGYVFTLMLLFYFLKAALTYFFYQSVGSNRKWAVFYFTNTRFYFISSLALITLCVFHYYFPIDKTKMFFGYLYFFAILHVFKILFYLFHKNNILPETWYYKILYICTLQIMPLFALWKLLFF